MYGLLQERIMTRPYETDGENEEYFKFSVFLVLSNRLLSRLMALGDFGVFERERATSVAGIHRYCAVSLSNVIATYCQYEALKYVSFPVQTLGKCAKIYPG